MTTPGTPPAPGTDPGSHGWFGRPDSWQEIAPGVLLQRHRLLDQNITLILGDRYCLVVDTTSHQDLGRQLVADLRALTPLPWLVVNTHAHFDHCFGNAVLAAAQPGLEIWAQERCRTELLERAEQQRADGEAWMRRVGTPADVAAIRATQILAPNRTVVAEQVLDLGGRRVRLFHPGRGHTDHDLVVQIPDAGVSVMGDLVDEGMPPSFEDSFPLEWPETLSRVDPLPLVVSGHGGLVDPEYVARLGHSLRGLAERALELRAGAAPPDAKLLLSAARSLEFGVEASLVGLRRALEQPEPPR